MLNVKEAAQIADLERRIRNLEKDAADDGYGVQIYCDCTMGCRKCGWHGQYTGNVPNKNYRPPRLKAIRLPPSVPDRIEDDGTENAHPAWNRGFEAGKNAVLDRPAREMNGILTMLEDVKRFAAAGEVGRQYLRTAIESLEMYVQGCLEDLENECASDDNESNGQDS